MELRSSKLRYNNPGIFGGASNSTSAEKELPIPTSPRQCEYSANLHSTMIPSGCEQDSRAWQDCEYVMDSWYTEDNEELSVSEEYGEEFIAAHPNHIVTSDFERYEELVKCGNKAKYIDNSNKVKAIEESKAYNTMIDSMEVIEVESARTKLDRISLAFQQLVDDHGHEEIQYEGFTMQEHIDTLEEIINDM